jgi:hypothetical protein
MVIQVIYDDIVNGKRRISFQCPVALALKRATGKVFGVTPSYIRLHGTDKRYKVSPELAAWIKAYDEQAPIILPITFELQELKEDRAAYSRPEGTSSRPFSMSSMLRRNRG